MRAIWLFCLVGCQPEAVVAPPALPEPVAVVAHEDDCRRDIPDCSAACALRETHHLDFIDWYDRRCAAVILGKNPDKVAGKEPPPSLVSETPHDISDNPYR